MYWTSKHQILSISNVHYKQINFKVKCTSCRRLSAHVIRVSSPVKILQKVSSDSAQVHWDL